MDRPGERQRFGAYWLLRRLAKGGMAEVFLASPITPGQQPERVVIKRMLPQFSGEEEFLRLFLQEARLASQLSHPNIVRIFDLGLVDGQPFLAMEYVDGRDLESLTRPLRRWLPPSVAAKVGSEVCAALFHAHFATDLEGRPMQVVHRDVTPENVMISRRGEVKLVDFGVARASTRLQSTRPGVVRGKVAYLSPEHLAGRELDGRADLFSLGATLYELTTGFKPFERPDTASSLQAVVNETPPAPTVLLPGYPPDLSALIMRALEKDPARRFATAKEMKAELDRFLAFAGQPVGAIDLASLVASAPEPPQVSSSPGMPAAPPSPSPRAPAPRASLPPPVDLDDLEDEETQLEREATEIRAPRPALPSLAPEGDEEAEEETSQGQPLPVPRPPPRAALRPARLPPPVADEEVRTRPPRAADPQTRIETSSLDVGALAPQIEREPTNVRELPERVSEPTCVTDISGRGEQERPEETRVTALPKPQARRGRRGPVEDEEPQDAEAPRPASGRRVLLAISVGLLAGAALLGAAWLGRQSAILEFRSQPPPVVVEEEEPPPPAVAPADASAEEAAPDAAAVEQEPDAGTEPSSPDAGPPPAVDAGAPVLKGVGVIVVPGRERVLIDGKPCKAPCAVRVQAGEHVVQFPGKGKRKVEHKVLVLPGAKETVRR